MGRRSGIAAAVLPLALVTAGLAGAPAAVAGESGADACTHPAWSNQDPGTDELRGSETEAPVRSGPNAGCGTVGYLHYETVSLDCFVVNSAGNTWSHIQFTSSIGKKISGWIYDPHLAGNGSGYYC
ncbi:SH3 domain-containing protein [Streptomyces sp. MS19]|uniref:SH3 domain-containing protein n=1 Tax=Streptomyces sp. MS19 TaxID=3385972 RepID=UPI0039A0D24E